MHFRLLATDVLAAGVGNALVARERLAGPDVPPARRWRDAVQRAALDSRPNVGLSWPKYDTHGAEQRTDTMFKGDHGGVRAPKQTSAPQNTAVGSGSRPMGGKMTIPTSAPEQPHELDRAPPGWLK